MIVRELAHWYTRHENVTILKKYLDVFSFPSSRIVARVWMYIIDRDPFQRTLLDIKRRSRNVLYARAERGLTSFPRKIHRSGSG